MVVKYCHFGIVSKAFLPLKNDGIMKILSKILVDAYYELGSKTNVPLMMQWNSDGLSTIAVSRSDGDFFILKNPAVISRTAIFNIETGNDNVFGRFISSLPVRINDIHHSIEDAIQHLVKLELKPSWVIGPADEIHKKYGHCLTNGLRVIDYPLKNRILVVPEKADLGCFLILSRKDIERAYASYIVKNPLEYIRFVEWNNT